jgi:hypothetical protein
MRNAQHRLAGAARRCSWVEAAIQKVPRKRRPETPGFPRFHSVNESEIPHARCYVPEGQHVGSDRREPRAGACGCRCRTRLAGCRDVPRRGHMGRPRDAIDGPASTASGRTALAGSSTSSRRGASTGLAGRSPTWRHSWLTLRDTASASRHRGAGPATTRRGRKSIPIFCATSSC